jgi:hypothetical protein
VVGASRSISPLHASLEKQVVLISSKFGGRGESSVCIGDV